MAKRDTSESSKCGQRIVANRTESQEISLTSSRFETILKITPSTQHIPATPLDMQCLKLFAEFFGRTMKGEVRGRLDPEKPNADTGSVRGAMRRFCNAWKRMNHQEIPHQIKLSMAPVSIIRNPTTAASFIAPVAD